MLVKKVWGEVVVFAKRTIVLLLLALDGAVPSFTFALGHLSLGERKEGRER